MAAPYQQQFLDDLVRHNTRDAISNLRKAFLVFRATSRWPATIIPTSLKP